MNFTDRMKLIFVLFITICVVLSFIQPTFAQESADINNILERAAHDGDVNFVLESVLSHPSLLNERDSKGLSPLLFAVIHDNNEATHQVSTFSAIMNIFLPQQIIDYFIINS